MAIKKGGLGRGLDALMMDSSTEDGSKTVSLRLVDVVPNPDQPRHRFEDDALEELAASVGKHGILQPLLVRPMADGSYQIVAGERRWRAARMAGLSEVPVVIRELSDRETAELALIENLQREDLNPMEEALGYQHLIEQYDLTQEQVATAVNKSRPAVANAMRLLKLPASVSQMVSEGTLSAGHARALLALEDETAMHTAAKICIEQDLSVRAAEALVKAHKADQKSPKKTPAFSAGFEQEVALALSESMGRRIKVTKGKKGGTLQIEYFDVDDLRSLAKTLGGEE
ncbi:MAG: ParB/RepB/Spo0J family partition protein [Clostridia bacterium]|nr:ParB/RepB/Spo0J family partition protein [Clostridia bacterium]